ncbi:hypothetical protein ACRALDRAFT_207107 [Sodiomyces alcalophilus JCM 7366]|uniref:uncharacterized protein n=1 Tax=Sodiomyces alcalophilus JCM 7366 TaxID=591952 RepID=UPI0039B5AFCE
MIITSFAFLFTLQCRPSETKACSSSADRGMPLLQSTARSLSFTSSLRILGRYMDAALWSYMQQEATVSYGCLGPHYARHFFVNGRSGLFSFLFSNAKVTEYNRHHGFADHPQHTPPSRYQAKGLECIAGWRTRNMGYLSVLMENEYQRASLVIEWEKKMESGFLQGRRSDKAAMSLKLKYHHPKSQNSLMSQVDQVQHQRQHWPSFPKNSGSKSTKPSPPFFFPLLFVLVPSQPACLPVGEISRGLRQGTGQVKKEEPVVGGYDRGSENRMAGDDIRYFSSFCFCLTIILPDPGHACRYQYSATGGIAGGCSPCYLFLGTLALPSLSVLSPFQMQGTATTWDEAGTGCRELVVGIRESPQPVSTLSLLGFGDYEAISGAALRDHPEENPVVHRLFPFARLFKKQHVGSYIRCIAFSPSLPLSTRTHIEAVAFGAVLISSRSRPSRVGKQAGESQQSTFRPADHTSVAQPPLSFSLPLSVSPRHHAYGSNLESLPATDQPPGRPVFWQRAGWVGDALANAHATWIIAIMPITSPPMTLSVAMIREEVSEVSPGQTWLRCSGNPPDRSLHVRTVTRITCSVHPFPVVSSFELAYLESFMSIYKRRQSCFVGSADEALLMDRRPSGIPHQPRISLSLLSRNGEWGRTRVNGHPFMLPCVVGVWRSRFSPWAGHDSGLDFGPHLGYHYVCSGHATQAAPHTLSLQNTGPLFSKVRSIGYEYVHRKVVRCNHSTSLPSDTCVSTRSLSRFDVHTTSSFVRNTTYLAGTGAEGPWLGDQDGMAW